MTSSELIGAAYDRCIEVQHAREVIGAYSLVEAVKHRHVGNVHDHRRETIDGLCEAPVPPAMSERKATSEKKMKKKRKKKLPLNGRRGDRE